MKSITIKRVLSVLVAAISLVGVLASCEQEQPIVIEYLDVTTTNIAGEWELVEWNGAPLQEGSYMRITFDRKEKTYTMYTNLDTAKERVITGGFNIVTDEALGAVIKGDYDYVNDYWSHNYVVSELTQDSMKWTAIKLQEDEPDDVQIFNRVK